MLERDPNDPHDQVEVNDDRDPDAEPDDIIERWGSMERCLDRLNASLRYTREKKRIEQIRQGNHDLNKLQQGQQ